MLSCLIWATARQVAIWTSLCFTHLYCEETSLMPRLMDCQALRQVNKTVLKLVKQGEVL